MNLYEISVQDIHEKEVLLENYKNKVLLIVNTASFCGYTPQYKELESLYQELGHDQFEILAFPCNQFGHQEPGTNHEIMEFCTLKYNVTFPVFSKIDVNGNDTHPLYKYLKESKLGLFNEAIKWNFTKFLVDKNGNVIDRFASSVSPLSLKDQITNLME
ncbi:MAG: Peroxiredoxin [Haloplasmataceae bacterium]|jgi:glutathione peroxidase|nr:Peroxiredoxin [Haloplasmataceae bacterium]